MEKMSLSERVTYSTVLIRCKYKNGSSGTGTGFIMRLCEDKQDGTHIPVIITNKHVVEDYVECSFEFCLKGNDGNPIDTKIYTFVYNNYNWIYHPDSNVDLCCLPIAEALNQTKKNNVDIFYLAFGLDILPTNTDIQNMTAMESVTMVGYPIGISDNYNHKPVIRRGTTATHYRKNYNGKPEVLLDIACHPGSSGSPVFLLEEGLCRNGNTYSFGSQIKLIAVLYGGHEQTKAGALTFNNIPTMPKPIFAIPINLGVAVKANEILKFEDIFKPKHNDKTKDAQPK